MHFIEDTEDEDSAAELFWKEEYKKVLREKISIVIYDEITKNSSFKGIYKKQYRHIFRAYYEFIILIAGMVEIGSENGSDEAFNEIYSAFKIQGPLPEPRRHARHYWPKALTPEISKEVHEAIVDEYSKETSYQADYEEHYSRIYPDFRTFLDQIAELVVVGAINGTDEMLGKIYRAFLLSLPLPPARRRPRQLKGW
jgi:hypothetical protein